MSRHFLLDTDVMVDFLRGYPGAIAFIKANADRIILSSIVTAELYAGAGDAKDLQLLDQVLSLFPVIPVTATLARTAGIYKRNYYRSHGTGLGDAIIAATAEAEHAELKTLNVKHYPMLRGLKMLYIKK